MKAKYWGVFFAALVVPFCLSCELYGYGTLGGIGLAVDGNMPPLLYENRWATWDNNTGKKIEAFAFGEVKNLPFEWFDHYHLKDEYSLDDSDTFFYVDYFKGGEWENRDVAIARKVSNFSGSSGVIILEYLDPRTPNSGARLTNPFQGLYFRILSDSRVQFAPAKNFYKGGVLKIATAEEAFDSFTMSNEGDYVDWAYALVYIKE